jgi:hypothetical protein
MAGGATLDRAVQRTAAVLRDYAREQGWGPEDFRLYASVSPEWEHIHVIFVSKGFEGRDYYESYASVKDYLSKRLADSPDLANALGLVIRDFKQVEQGGFYGIGPDYSEI